MKRNHLKWYYKNIKINIIENETQPFKMVL
jgi:hypothetical protein